RTIDVIGAGTGGPGLVVARLEPGDVEVDRVAMHDRRDGVEEGERCFAGKGADRIGKRRRGERAGGDDDAVPVRRRLEDFLSANVDERFALDRRGDRGGKAFAVDGERSAGRQLVAISRTHYQRTQP